MKTLDIIEAAEALKVHKNTALELAETGELEGAKIGRAWVFLPADVEKFIRDQVIKQVQERRKAKPAEPRKPGRPRLLNIVQSGS